MIELRGLSKTYQSESGRVVDALVDVNLEIQRGEIHGIVGQSGAGKSTLIRCLTTLESPTSGEVIVNGEDLSRLGQSALRRARRNIGMVFQHANLLDARTVEQNIAYPLRLNGTPAAETKARVAELLEFVGLTERANSYPSELSGGQKQRVGIARALADRPPVVLCDEPTSALDSETTGQILHLLSDLREQFGVTVVIITHEMSVVREICDSVTLLEDGKVATTGPLEELVKDVTSRLTCDLVPFPAISARDVTHDAHGNENALLDVRFTSSPGKPTGSAVMTLASSLSGDLAAGTFETLGRTQVGRLALTVPRSQVKAALAAFHSHNIFAEEVPVV
ncbi:methionine ABC transporter ATP-binding protein [Boudabousia marimammalium]|nr:methionine ABC transporter ATP-binding protein [Boudabousia marimammalium]